MERFYRSLAIAMILGQFLAHNALGLTSDGRLTQDAKVALLSLGIGANEINVADGNSIGLVRSFQLLLPLVKFEAANNPADGPIRSIGSIDALDRILKQDALKNAGFPKIQVADLPPQLVAALRGTKAISDSTTELTAVQLAALLRNRKVIAAAQKELNKLGDRTREAVRSQYIAFFNKIDRATEKLTLAYKTAIVSEERFLTAAGEHCDKL